MLNKKIIIIGSGFSGLSSAAYLAKEGYDVHLYEKNSSIGGRARQFHEEGFVFDMGPSWYWMPEIMEKFYNDFGYSTSDFYELKKLTPAFDMVFDDGITQIPNDYNALKNLFEELEPGSADRLDSFMDDAKTKYDISMADLIETPSLSIKEFLTIKTISNAFSLRIFSSYQKLVHRYFQHSKLRALMEFPVLFLGAMPNETPALYSLMNYAGLKLGTWYPDGGFFSVIKAMEKICLELGVKFHLDSPIDKIHVSKGNVLSVESKGNKIALDGLVASADYHHVEKNLLDKAYRNYSDAYWKKKTFAPSSLIFYLGLDKKIDGLNHHTLFFDENIDHHAVEIYKDKKWPEKPLFYVCAPSVTDKSVAPDGCENLFVLMPLATGLKDDEKVREQYFDILISRIETQFDVNIIDHIIVKHSYCVSDFKKDYNAYGGNAYGLANTLTQTAFLKPKIQNKKVKNLIYSGQLTVPGPGVPPSIISGRIAANLLTKTIT